MGLSIEVDGKAGQTIVAEVQARRLDSPFDSFVKITTADGMIIALNDDHHDAASGLNTDHADSYLMASLPADAGELQGPLVVNFYRGSW